MTYEEAYKILTEHTRNYIPLCDSEALEVAIKVLKERMKFGITYCTNAACQFTDCERHWQRIKDETSSGKISVADFGGVCRRYLSGLLDEIEQEEGAQNE